MPEVGVDLALDDDYRAPALNRFFYQLHDVTVTDTATSGQQTEPRLRLRGLAPGTYELRAWGQTPAGQRTLPRHLRLTVARPW